MSTSESYLQQLQNFQEKYPSVEYDLNIPEDEIIYTIDQVTRKINGPKTLGVVEDHQADRIVFEIDRDCNGYDLAQTVCLIVFKNAKGEIFSYLVPKYNITKDKGNLEENESAKLYFVWTLQAPVMAKAGTVQYMVKFFRIDNNGKILFEFNTQIASGTVLNTWENRLTDISSNYNILVDPQILSLFSSMQTAIDQGYFDVYWKDL